MAEPEIKEEENMDPNQNYIETIQKMKETMVSKDDYERLMQQNKQLLDTVVNGGSVDDPKQTAEDLTKSINDIRNDLRKNEHMTNLDFAKATLKLREQVLERDGKDIFVSPGSKYTPTRADYEAAQKVADVFKECIDAADGDPETFTHELQRRTAG